MKYHYLYIIVYVYLHRHTHTHDESRIDSSTSSRHSSFIFILVHPRVCIFGCKLYSSCFCQEKKWIKTASMIRSLGAILSRSYPGKKKKKKETTKHILRGVCTFVVDKWNCEINRASEVAKDFAASAPMPRGETSHRRADVPVRDADNQYSEFSSRLARLPWGWLLATAAFSLSLSVSLPLSRLFSRFLSPVSSLTHASSFLSLQRDNRPSRSLPSS